MSNGSGPLRYKVETSSPQVEAGKDFSVFIKITNPYSVPISVRSVTTRLPVEFTNVESMTRERRRDELNERLNRAFQSEVSKKLDVSGLAKNLQKEKIREIAQEALRLLPFGGIFNVGYAVSQLATATSLDPSVKAAQDVGDLIKPEDVDEILHKVGPGESGVETLKNSTIELLKKKLASLDDVPETLLQPGDSTVKVFTLRTKRSLLFTPSTYNLHVQAEYVVEDLVHHDSVDYQFSVRASLGAVISGAVVGSIMGFLLRDIFRDSGLVALITNPTLPGSVSWLVKLIGNLLLGVVLVIAFARKKDSQPILTIEDFWGGVMIGAIASYSGQSVLDEYLIKAPSPSGASVP